MDNGHYELVFTLYTAVSHAAMIPVFHVCTTPVFHHPAVFKHCFGCLYLFLTISIIQHQRISLHDKLLNTCAVKNEQHQECHFWNNFPLKLFQK